MEHEVTQSTIQSFTKENIEIKDIPDRYYVLLCDTLRETL